MTFKRKLYLILFFALCVGAFFLAWQNISLKQQLSAEQKAVKDQQVNGEVLTFARLFTDDVLNNNSISFDQRLQLENDVRAINDPVIYAAWQKFTNAQKQTEMQAEFSNLLSLLLKKMN